MSLSICDLRFAICDLAETGDLWRVAGRSRRRPAWTGAADPEIDNFCQIQNPKSKIEKAFTLIELMIVISIIAIVITAGIPPFARAMRKEGLRKAVSDMVEGCSHARAQAILNGAPTELIIRAEDGQISVRPAPVVKSDEERDAAAPPKPAPGGTFKANLPDDIAIKLLYVNFQDQMEFPEARVRFFPNGTCDEFTVILSSATGEQEVTLDVVTALADVKVIR
jgi:prepilin-type N-terminal cleavage/methylation domain-containing protein